MNIVLHLLFQAFTSTLIDNMFQESIVQKVPVEVQNGPDLCKCFWWWNVCELFFNETLVLSAHWYWKVCDTGKQDMEVNFLYFSASFIDEITKSILKVLNLILNRMCPCWMSNTNWYHGWTVIPIALHVKMHTLYMECSKAQIWSYYYSKVLEHISTLYAELKLLSYLMLRVGKGIRVWLQ